MLHGLEAVITLHLSVEEELLSLVEDHTFEELLDLPPEEAYPLAEAALGRVIAQ